MNEKTLFLAWQDKDGSRKWFPIGRLDVEKSKSIYRFRYLQGAKNAQNKSKFEPLLDFPNLQQIYESSTLFPLFQNRVLAPGRKDFREYLEHLDLSDNSDPIEILAVDGGYRVTDSFEVFPKIERKDNGAFACRFFLHGWRYVPESSQKRLQELTPDEELIVAIELNNPKSPLTIQVQTSDHYVIGWAPRYLVSDLVHAISESRPGDYQAKVVKINPIPAPSKQRLLVELTCHWPDYEPMNTPEFQPLAQ